MKTKKIKEESTIKLLDFINRSPTSFHAVEVIKKRLEIKGFQVLDETSSWRLREKGKYFVMRNDSSLIAFEVGLTSPEESGFKIIGAHTDSPHLRLKPNPVYHKAGFVQLGVEVYGSVLLTTWTDRDLSLAGRVTLSDPKFHSILLDFKKPLLRIPQLAIHLNKKVNEKGLILNKQNHIPPIVSLAEGKLERNMIKKWIADEVGCKVKDILGFDLALYDTQKGSFGGRNDEFLFSARLDNLASCHAAVEAMCACDKSDRATRLLVFFDHEEIGSRSYQGAGSTFLKDVLERVQSHFNLAREAYLRSLAQSFFISVDMAHAVHPNYAELHDSYHWPKINGGPVIKINNNQNYASDGDSSARFEWLCKQAKVPVQRFVMRSDLVCGSTIGPIIASNLGVRTVDVGNPMLAMHSIREMAGKNDHVNLIQVLKTFFESGLKKTKRKN